MTSFPGARKVEIVPPAQGRATKNIIYIRMYHNIAGVEDHRTIEEWLSKRTLLAELVETDLLERLEKPKTEEDRKKIAKNKNTLKKLLTHVSNFIDIQTDIYTIITQLERMGIHDYFLEGLTENSQTWLKEIPQEVKKLRVGYAILMKLYNELEDKDPDIKNDAQEFAKRRRTLQATFDTTFLATGPAMLFRGIHVHPGEDSDLNRQIFSVKRTFKDKKEYAQMQKRREKFVVRQAVQSPKKNVVILFGAEHDLKDEFAEENQKAVEYGKGDICNLIIITPNRLP